MLVIHLFKILPFELRRDCEAGACLYVCMCVCMYVYVCVCVCVCVGRAFAVDACYARFAAAGRAGRS